MSDHLANRTVRNLTIISDLVLINLAFAFSYVARYEYQWLLPTIQTVQDAKLAVTAQIAGLMAVRSRKSLLPIPHDILSIAADERRRWRI